MVKTETRQQPIPNLRVCTVGKWVTAAPSLSFLPGRRVEGFSLPFVLMTMPMPLHPAVLEMEHKASFVLGQYCTSELHLKLWFIASGQRLAWGYGTEETTPAYPGWGHLDFFWIYEGSQRGTAS